MRYVLKKAKYVEQETKKVMESIHWEKIMAVGSSSMSGVGVILIVLGVVLALAAVAIGLMPSKQSASVPPMVSRLCEDAIAKVEDYSLKDPDSITINPSTNCFGATIKFPRSWQRWIFQEGGRTRSDSWLAGWSEGSTRPSVPIRSVDLTSWVNSADAMRFAGQGSYLAIAISRNTPAPTSVSAVPVKVQGNESWTDTGIALRSGDLVTFLATGFINVGGDPPLPTIPPMPPAGYPPNCNAANDNFAPSTDGVVQHSSGIDLPCWSLLGRVGEQGLIFEVGGEQKLRVADAGELYLGVNDNHPEVNSGNWTVSVAVSSKAIASRGGGYQNRICEGANDGETEAVHSDHSTENISSFSVEMEPGCFSGYILMPAYWNSYIMEPETPSDNWWMAYKWYQSRNSGSGERPPLRLRELLALGRHTSQKIRVQGSGRLVIRSQ
jgi:hypothetical protein